MLNFGAQLRCIIGDVQTAYSDSLGENMVGTGRDLNVVLQTNTKIVFQILIR